MRIPLTAIFFLTVITAIGQLDKKESINLLFGYGKHGSGDLTGFQYGLQYSKEFGERWTWILEFGGSLHDAQDDELIYQDQIGNDVDATLHFVIGGIQAGIGTNYSFVKSDNHRLGITILPIIRYQATSISDLIATFSPGATDLPFPVRVLERFEPARTVSIGSAFRVGYEYSLGENYVLGIQASFQTDTNGDSILGSLFSFGKTF